MKFLIRIPLLAVCLALSLPSSALAGELKLAEDTMELIPAISQGQSVNAAEQNEISSLLGGDANITIRLRQVNNITGNNPFNPIKPLLNYNGVEVNSVADLVTLMTNSNAGGGNAATSAAALADCVKTVTMHTVLAPPNPIYGANFDIDPATLKCNTPPPGIAGQGNFSITEAPGDATNTAYYAGSAPPNAGDWVLDGAGSQYVAGSQVTFTATSNQGKRIQVTFNVTQGSPSTIQILSITAL